MQIKMPTFIREMIQLVGAHASHVGGESSILAPQDSLSSTGYGPNQPFFPHNKMCIFKGLSG